MHSPANLNVTGALQLSSAWFGPCSDAGGDTRHSADGAQQSVSLAIPQDHGESTQATYIQL